MNQLPPPERPRRRPQPAIARQDDPAALRPRLPLRVQHRRKIIDVIRSGSVIGKAPIVSMPHWGGIIPDDQLQALAAYIKTLSSRDASRRPQALLIRGEAHLFRGWGLLDLLTLCGAHHSLTTW